MRQNSMLHVLLAEALACPFPSSVSVSNSKLAYLFQMGYDTAGASFQGVLFSS